MINLAKDQKIDLTKQDGSELETVSFGVNWGMKKAGFFGGKTAVDLDASVVVFDDNNTILDTISYQKLRNSWITHSGDDRVGDDEDDGQDNETITVNLSGAPENAKSVVFFLNSFTGDNFKDIPHAGIRIYEGRPKVIINEQDTVLANFDVKTKSGVSMVLAKLYKRNGKWKFQTIGEVTQDRKMDETVRTIKNNFL